VRRAAPDEGPDLLDAGLPARRGTRPDRCRGRLRGRDAWPSGPRRDVRRRDALPGCPPRNGVCVVRRRGLQRGRDRACGPHCHRPARAGARIPRIGVSREPLAGTVVRGVRTDSVEGRPAEDAVLVERAQHGATEAYGELVRRYQALATRTAYVITGLSAEAEDAAQDGFTKAYFALARFRTGAPFRPWLLRIVANEAKNRRKAAGLRPTGQLRGFGRSPAAR